MKDIVDPCSSLELISALFYKLPFKVVTKSSDELGHNVKHDCSSSLFSFKLHSRPEALQLHFLLNNKVLDLIFNLGKTLLDMSDQKLVQL